MGKNTAEHDDGLTKVSFLILLHQTFFFKILNYSSYDTRSENVQNTAGVNHFRCCAIEQIPWSLSRLQEISEFYKTKPVTLSQLVDIHH